MSINLNQNCHDEHSNNKEVSVSDLQKCSENRRFRAPRERSRRLLEYKEQIGHAREKWKVNKKARDRILEVNIYKIPYYVNLCRTHLYQ